MSLSTTQTPSDCLPQDADRATLVGRAWLPGVGPAVVGLRGAGPGTGCGVGCGWGCGCGWGFGSWRGTGTSAGPHDGLFPPGATIVSAFSGSCPHASAVNFGSRTTRMPSIVPQNTFVPSPLTVGS